MDSQSQLDSYLSTILKINPQYHNKISDLFRGRQDQSISQKHYARNIVTNPKTFFDLIQSNFLSQTKKESLLQYYQYKTEVMSLVAYLIEDFPLNAKFIYEEAFLVVEDNRRINLMVYLIRDIGQSYRYLQENNVVKSVYENYIDKCTTIFHQICLTCTLSTSQLKLLTNNLTQLYYQTKLSTKVISQHFRMLESGLQQRTITPYLYFIDNDKNDSVKVLFTNNKWPFGKGMTLVVWLNMLKMSNCKIFWLKTEDGNQLVVKVENGMIVVECIYKEKGDSFSVQICQFPTNTITVVGIELEAISQGIFRSISYLLNININGTEYKNITNKIPKFQASEFVVEYSLLKNFIGNLYSILITAKNQLNMFEEICKYSQYGICSETLVWQLIDSKLLKTETILCVFNAERFFQGLLLNYVHQKNHACYEGRVSSVKYHKYDQKVVDIFMPFLYFMTLIKNKDQEWLQLYDLINQYLISVISKQRYELKQILFILYFIELNGHRISQSTLNLLVECSQEGDNHYIKLGVKYLDRHALIELELKIGEDDEPYEDPVQRIIFMFYLESLWDETWNKLQGFQGWWSPLFFHSQNNRPYDPEKYLQSDKREGRVEWSVMNFVTKDFCKCLVEPKFIIPQYGKLNRFQQEYLKKECFRQDFKLKLYHLKKGDILMCEKKSNSSLEKLKNLVMKGGEKEQSPKKKQSEYKQFQAPCLYIDILTIIIGTARVTKDGFLIINSRHEGKRFDHMCVKAFKQQYFLYQVILLTDIRKIYKKRFNATSNAIYIKLKDGRQLMLYFYQKNKGADIFLGIISSVVKIKKDPFSSYLNGQQPVKWIDKYMSNYQYLQWLNQIAGRSYNDITQYPVIPWTFITKSKKVQEDQKPFRDLTKNMGLQGDQDRIRYFTEKYSCNNEEELFSQYHFGTHYSSSAIIFNFLIRIRPYSIGALTLQSGKFDVADRIFYSFCGSWNNAISSPTDLRELIPEVYTLPQMFINQNNYEYGQTQDKVVVDNVILPAWTQNNPYRFVAELRRKLQSRYVSENINHWIDLVYGYKQRGKDAIENMNIFYPLTYENSIDLQKVEEWDEKESFQTQIAHFGQNPAQIIGNNPHPKRLAQKANWQDKLVSDGKDLTIQKCFLSKAPLAQQRFIFKSVFEGRNSILSIKFISQQLFFVLRKHQYCLFQILNEKSNFLSKQQQIKYQLESVRASLNYKELTTKVPIISINQEVMIIGGYYYGNTQIIFLKEEKYNQIFRFPVGTITAMGYHQHFRHLFIGDSEGYLNVYRVSVTSRQIQFQSLKSVKAHDSKINDLVININANLVVSCSEDGSLSFYNCYSVEIMRTIRHPANMPIHLAHITTSPLYAVVFYSKQDSTVYVYSINGQMLDNFCEKTGFVYNMSVLRSTDSTQSLVYLNAQRELFVWELPFLRLKRKVKVKRDDFRISCFETCFNSKIAVAGTEQGGLQLIANPSSY